MYTVLKRTYLGIGLLIKSFFATPRCRRRIALLKVLIEHHCTN